MGVDTAYGWYGRGMGRRDGRILGGTAGDMYVRARCLVNTALVIGRLVGYATRLYIDMPLYAAACGYVDIPTTHNTTGSAGC